MLGGFAENSAYKMTKIDEMFVVCKILRFGNEYARTHDFIAVGEPKHTQLSSVLIGCDFRFLFFIFKLVLIAGNAADASRSIHAEKTNK